MAHDPNELFTLADQLRLLVKQGIAEEEAKARLRKTFSFRGQEIYSPKFAVSYEDAVIHWETGRVTLRRLRRHAFTPTLTAAAHHALFPPPSASRRLTAAAEAETTNWLIALMNTGDPTQSKYQYCQQAQRKFGVGKNAFARAWASAITTSGNNRWSRAGPKSTRRIDSPV
jgi:hypothetical protein